jgi:hypothetical protein
MKKTRYDELKRVLIIGFIAYRKTLRKYILKLVLIANMVLFILALANNMPSMMLYLVNIYYLYKYMLDQYPEASLKRKDRYELKE